MTKMRNAIHKIQSHFLNTSYYLKNYLHQTNTGI